MNPQILQQLMQILAAHYAQQQVQNNGMGSPIGGPGNGITPNQNPLSMLLAALQIQNGSMGSPGNTNSIFGNGPGSPSPTPVGVNNNINTGGPWNIPTEISSIQSPGSQGQSGGGVSGMPGSTSGSSGSMGGNGVSDLMHTMLQSHLNTIMGGQQQ